MSANRRLTRFALVLVLVACQQEPASRSRPESDVDRMARVEQGLRRVVRLASQPELTFDVETRMMHYSVPGLSLAVIDDFEVGPAKAWGVTEKGAETPVTTETLFRACSLSKTVAAVAALSLAEEGTLPLDVDVNELLEGWQVPESDYIAVERPTVERILSHTAGFNVWGFGPFEPGEPLPTLRQILDGEPPARNEPIRVVLEPGSERLYSGGGYTVLEQILTDVGGAPYAEIVRERVFGPLAMTRSTYHDEGPDTIGVAAGHDGLGHPIPGRFGAVPELAAAGLRTTPTELAALLADIMEAWAGRGGMVLATDTTHDMFLDRMDGTGLGVFLEGEGRGLQISHGGIDNGYHAYFVAYPALGEGAVVMSNGDRGNKLQQEVLRSLATEYGWPHFEQVTFSDVDLPVEDLGPFAGKYEIPDTWSFEIEIEAGTTLAFVEPDGYRARLTASGPTSFFDPDDGSRIEFELESSGNVRAVRIRTLAGDEIEAVPLDPE